MTLSGDIGRVRGITESSVKALFGSPNGQFEEVSIVLLRPSRNAKKQKKKHGSILQFFRV
jgi:hypothetical protein